MFRSTCRLSEEVELAETKRCCRRERAAEVDLDRTLRAVAEVVVDQHEAERLAEEREGSA